jgi:hypothetical protein
MKRFVIGVVLCLAAALAGVLIFDASAKPKPLSGDELARAVHAMASIARETALFAEQLEDDRLSHAFAKAHRDKLAEILDDERDKLEATLPSSLAGSGERARALGSELDTSLAELRRHLADREGLARIRQQVRHIESELARLEPAS